VLRPLFVEADVDRSSTRMHEAGADVVVHNAKEAVEAIENLLADAPVMPTSFKTVGQALA
jgi:2-methylisocitrate lyase-like PEP mutase family enzyme